jgi:hypothetical protein
MATEHLIDPSSFDTEALARGDDWGTVTAVIGEDVVIAQGDRSTLARRAASCLLAPQAGDDVLLARVGERYFVLAVLERSSDARAIEVEGDLTLRSRAGTVTVEGAEAVRLRTAGALSAAGKTLTLAAKQASWASEQLRVLSDHLSLEATRIREVASFKESVLESVKETLGRSYRHIRDAEHVDAGTITMSLRATLRCHAETAIHTAKKLVKLNADQIHLG